MRQRKLVGMRMTSYSTAAPAARRLQFLSAVQLLLLLLMLELVMLGLQPVYSLSSLSEREYCHLETFSANCAENQVIVIRSAQYGRMRKNRCIRSDNDIHVIGCRENVIGQTDRLCSGRRNCRVEISERTFSVYPCPSEYKSHFEVIYDCLQVTTIDYPACSSDKFVRLRNNFGYLSNSVVETYKYGSLGCPWRIEMSRGQRINLTLIDFSTPTKDLASSESGSMNIRGTCYQYAILTERSSTTRNVRICGGERRERNVYTSRTNSVDIRFITKGDVDTDKEYFFLLRYEAVGCSDPDPPKNGWSIRESDGAKMGCNVTGHTWWMTCDETESKWIGNYENCSLERFNQDMVVWGRVNIPYTVSMVVIITMSVIAVIIILLLSLLCIEWRKGSRSRIRSQSMQAASREPMGQHQQQQHHCQQNQDNHSKIGYTQALTSASTVVTPAAAAATVASSGSVASVTTLPSTGHHPNSSHPADDQKASVVVRAAVVTDPAGVRIAPDETPPRICRNSNDYVREMWPMAPPPGNLSGTILGGGMDQQSDARSSSLFQYGDSVTLTSSTATTPNAHARAATPGRAGAQTVSLLDVEDDTHIYETPKYLRREKAATMRLQKGGIKTQSYYESIPATTASPASNAAVAEPDFRYSRTLPRQVVSGNRRS